MGGRAVTIACLTKARQEEIRYMYITAKRNIMLCVNV